MKNGRFDVKIVAIACVLSFVFLNLIVQKTGEIVNIKFDCTENKIFRLSNETKEFLKTIDEEITFLYLTESGEQYPYVTQTMDRYIKESNKIRLETVDIVRNPMFVQKYTTGGSVGNGTIVVESSKRFKLVDPGAALMIMNSGENVSGKIGFALEEKLTNAIDFVLRDDNPIVKYASGHDSVDFALPAQKLNDENIAVEKIDITNEQFSPQDTDLLVLYGFCKDLSDAEYTKVTDYLAKGGKLYIALNPGVNCPKLKEITSEYGITINNDAVTEDNFSNIIKGNKLYLLVNPVGEVCENLSGKGSLLFPATSSLSLNESEKYKAHSTAVTFNSAKTRELLEANLGRDIKKGETSVAAISENVENASKLFVTATTQAFKPEDSAISTIMNSFSYVNREFFVQCVKYLIDSEGMNISIAPKSIMSRSLHFSNIEKLMISGIFILIPILVLIYGFVVCIRRRNR